MIEFRRDQAVAVTVSDGSSRSLAWRAAKPALKGAVRAIHRSPEFGVSPVVASTHVPSERRAAIRASLLSLHADPEAADALRGAGIERFTAPAPGLYTEADGVRRRLVRARREGPERLVTIAR